MNSQRTGLRVASVVFGLVALAHVWRLYKHANITFAKHVIPLEVSWVALIISALLCIWMWRLSSGAR